MQGSEDVLSESAVPPGAAGSVDVTGTVRVFGPASLSNLGPGFDAIGLCITGIGDVVEARLDAAPGVRIEAIEGDGGVLPTDPACNTAAVAAQTVLDALRVEQGLVLRICKQMPNGSGIGSSAASAVAGAWAANVALGRPLDKEDLVQAVLSGEQIASGARHGDNVLPALFGGLVLVSASDPSRYRRIRLPRALPIALVLPEVRVFTKAARDMLPAQVPLRDAVHNAGELAFLVDAFHCGDWETVGRCIMQDRLVEPVRATLVPCYDAVRAAAMDAGALGCALTGSGPALFALAETAAAAEQIVEAMVDACGRTGFAARGIVTSVDPDGVRVV
ncbi:MAG: homoserine kinase [Bacteroidetes bacterium]|nr:MAG: homoserine kinase [Bacteroidota bacterium]